MYCKFIAEFNTGKNRKSVNICQSYGKGTEILFYSVYIQNHIQESQANAQVSAHQQTVHEDPDSPHQTQRNLQQNQRYVMNGE